jgi:hypothetical protein
VRNGWYITNNNGPASLKTLSWDIKLYLEKNIKTFLINHIGDHEMIVCELAGFINRATDRLITFGPPGTDRSVLRKAYRNALISSLVLTNKDAPQTMFIETYIAPGSLLRRGSGDVFTGCPMERERNHLSSTQENVNDMLAAAAAVGDLAATRYYISQSAVVIDWFPKYFTGFGNPLVAAACNGNIEVLEYLLLQANNELEKRNFPPKPDNYASRCGPVTETITSAIRYAVRTGHLDAIVALFAFLPRCHVGIPAYMTSPSHYLADAIAWGHVEVMTWLMDRWSLPRTDASYRDIFIAGLRLAVEHGHIDVVRYVFDHGLLDPQEADANPVLLAAKHGHRAIIRLALDHGVQLSMQDLITALNGSVPLLMTQFLLQHNVPLATTTKDEYRIFVTASIIPTVETLCRESIHIPFGDRNLVRGREKILALIFLAREMKQQIPELMLDNCIELKKVLDRLVNRCVVLPKGAIPYLEMVRELHSWME